MLVDTSPDLRQQLLDVGTGWVDGVLYTHDHADHTHGIDDLRQVAFNGRRRVDVYYDADTGEAASCALLLLLRLAARQRISADPQRPRDPRRRARSRSAAPAARSRRCRSGKSTGPARASVSASAASPIRRMSAISREESLSALQDLDVWILDALRPAPHPSHLSVEQALDWIARVKPKRAVLTHMHVDLDYAALRARAAARRRAGL